MEFAWNWWALPAFIAFVLLAIMTSVIYLTRPERLQNRVVACVLFIIALVQLGEGLRFLLTDERGAFAAIKIRVVASASLYGLFLLFYSTLPTRMTSLLGKSGARRSLAGLAVLLPIFVYLEFDSYVGDMRRTSYLDVWIGTDFGYLWYAVQFAGIVLLLLGIPFLISAYRNARTLNERKKLKMMATAFIFVNVSGAAQSAFATVFVSSFGGSDSSTAAAEIANFTGISVVLSIFALILGYGVLRSQLFDIDLRLRWTIRQGTIIGVFLAIFVAAVQVTQNYLSDELGLVVGGVVTAAMLLAFGPIERLARRLSQAATPDATDSPEYIRVKKEEVFKSALEAALLDGVITDRERDVLTRLQLELGIANQQARIIEHDVRNLMMARPRAA